MAGGTVLLGQKKDHSIAKIMRTPVPHRRRMWISHAKPAPIGVVVFSIQTPGQHAPDTQQKKIKQFEYLKQEVKK